MQSMSDNDPVEDVKLPSELDALTKTIEAKPQALASADKEIYDTALAAAKYIFDIALKSESPARPHLTELLESIHPSQAPQTRFQARAAALNGEEKTPSVAKAITVPTPIASLVVDGMEDDQIWAQLELKTKNVCATLEDAFDAGETLDARGMRMLDENDEDDENDDSEEDSLDSDELEDLRRKYIEGMDVERGVMDLGIEDEESEEGEEDDDDDDDDDEEEEEEASAEEEDLTESVAELRDSSEEEEDNEEEEEEDILLRRRRRSASQSGGRKQGHPELDDDFFNLAEFNAEIEEAEANSVSRGALGGESDEESDDEMVDLYAPLDDDEGLGGEARYEDFFDPLKKQKPAKRKFETFKTKRGNPKVQFSDKVKVKTIKAKGKGRPLSSVDLYSAEDLNDEDDEDDADFDLEDDGSETQEIEEDDEFRDFRQENGIEEDEGREAVNRLKDDLFADDEEVPKSDLTAYEARLAAIRDQISQLEAENVGEKDWMLKGEVSSRLRPVNTLLEEDLDFETVQKAVPVITDEVVQDLEQRIKARILESRFDDVIRKRPVDDKPFLPSKLFELQDTKSKESLAQIYENEFITAQSGGTSNDRDSKLQKEHDEIEKQWESICYKLDALCNAHFTPKQPKATISSLSNASAVSIESALPTAKASSTVLAPEEVFAPDAYELRSKSEMTPAEKRAVRSKERKKKKKQRDALEKSVDKFAKMKSGKGVKKEKEEALKSVVKNGKGVTVIGKKSQDLKAKKPSRT